MSAIIRLAGLMFCFVFLSVETAAQNYTGKFLEFSLPFSPEQDWKLGNGYNEKGPFATHVKHDAYALDFNFGGEHEDMGVLIQSMYDGEVSAVNCEAAFTTKGYGCNVWIEHIIPGPNPQMCIASHYAHMLTATVTVGESVVKGQQVGILGNTGKSALASHLHISVRPCAGGNPLSTHSIPPLGMGGGTYDWTNPPIEVTDAYTSQQITVDPAYIGWFAEGFERCSGTYEEDPTCKNSESYVVATAHRKHAVASGNLCVYPSDNGSGVYLHEYDSEFTDSNGNRLLIQDFICNEFGKDGFIMIREDQPQAFAVRGGFHLQYFNGGPVKYGVPTSDEGGPYLLSHLENEVCVESKYDIAQTFEKGVMIWNKGIAADWIEYDDCTKKGGIVKMSSLDMYHITSSFTGSDEKTYTIGLSLFTEPQFYGHELQVIMPEGLTFDTLEILRDGVSISQSSSHGSIFTDYNVISGKTYIYQAVARYFDWGVVGSSSLVTVTVPYEPGTFKLTGYAASSSIIRLKVADLQYSNVLYRYMCDGEMLAISTGHKFTHVNALPGATHTCVVEVMNYSEEVIATTNTVVVLTPTLDVSPEPEPEFDPPVDPVLNLRVMSFEILTPEPHVSNECATIRYEVENVGDTSQSYRRFGAYATIDLGFQVVIRYFDTIQSEANDPFVIPPRGRFVYEGDNCGDTWPGVFGTGSIIPFAKIDSIAGDRDITDIGPNAEISEITIFTSHALPDYEVCGLRSVPEFPVEGDDVTIEFDLCNIGDANGATWHLVTHVDGETVDILESQVNQGQRLTFTRNLGVLSAGGHQILYEVDPENFVQEWNDENNSGSFTLVVSGIIQEEPEPTPAQCSDGIDNDGDGKIDWDDGVNPNPDPNCSGPNDNREMRYGGHSCGIGFEITPFTLLSIYLMNRRKKLEKTR